MRKYIKPTTEEFVMETTTMIAASEKTEKEGREKL